MRGRGREAGGCHQGRGGACARARKLPGAPPFRHHRPLRSRTLHSRRPIPLCMRDSSGLTSHAPCSSGRSCSGMSAAPAGPPPPPPPHRLGPLEPPSSASHSAASRDLPGAGMKARRAFGPGARLAPCTEHPISPPSPAASRAGRGALSRRRRRGRLRPHLSSAMTALRLHQVATCSAAQAAAGTATSTPRAAAAAPQPEAGPSTRYRMAPCGTRQTRGRGAGGRRVRAPLRPGSSRGDRAAAAERPWAEARAWSEQSPRWAQLHAPCAPAGLQRAHRPDQQDGHRRRRGQLEPRARAPRRLPRHGEPRQQRHAGRRGRGQPLDRRPRRGAAPGRGCQREAARGADNHHAGRQLQQRVKPGSGGARQAASGFRLTSRSRAPHTPHPHPTSRCPLPKNCGPLQPRAACCNAAPSPLDPPRHAPLERRVPPPRVPRQLPLRAPAERAVRQPREAQLGQRQRRKARPQAGGPSARDGPKCGLRWARALDQ